MTQTVHGQQISSRLVFRFHDGSVDDDQAIYTQQGVFRLNSDHHVQSGPSFPKAIDLRVDTKTGTVILREAENGTVSKVTRTHMDLPLDQPHDYHFLVLEGVAPTFVREEGQFFEGGPVWHVNQVGPVTK